MQTPLWAAAAACLCAAVAAVFDVRSRRIPNALTLSAFALAIAAHFAGDGASGAGSALAGGLVAGALLFPGWLLRLTGAGDVKLMAAVGAWLGWPSGLNAALAALVAGGVIAVLVALRHRSLKRALGGAARIGFWITAAGGAPGALPTTTNLRFPFATAILAGSIAALWMPVR